MRIIIVFFLGLAATLMASAQALQTARPVRIGVCVSRSGELSSTGSMYEKGLRLWMRDVNARGGILNREVTLDVKDDGSDPARTADAYKALAASGEDGLLFGPMAPDEAMAVPSILKASGFPCVFAMAAPEKLWTEAGGLAFGLQAPLPEWLSGFFEILSKSRAGSVAILTVDHPHCKTVLENATGWTRRYGLTVATAIASRKTGLADAVLRLTASAPDAVAVLGTPSGCEQAIRLLKRSPLGRKILFVSSSQPPSAFLTLPAREMEGVFTALPWDERSAKAFDGGSRFVAAFREAYGQDPDYVAASAYAAGQLVEAAATKAGNLRKDDLRLALAGLDTLTILGRYGVDPTGRQLRQFPLTLQMQKGKREVVWPEELRTARPAMSRQP